MAGWEEGPDVSTPSVGGPRALVVDDDPYVRQSLREILEHDGYRTLEAADGKVALELLDDRSIDLVLLDLELPRVSGVAVLRHMVDHHRDVAVVIVSGKGSIPAAVDTIKLGAFDFLEKPLDAPRTLQTARRALEAAGRAVTGAPTDVWERYEMVGTGPAMTQVYRSIDRAAASGARILLMGESGTGKERVARAIHHNSDRRCEDFVAVNCAAIPENLIESEMFGHVKGAFTGAVDRHRGRFQQAHGGTLLLDEVGDMSLMTQARVLRAVEEGRVWPVGAERPVEVDVRLIAATNKDLAAEVREGNFREDLFYRLNVVTIELPPLRHRREDIPGLVDHFLEAHCREIGTSAKELSPAAVAELVAYDWPGNIRQLANVVERLVVFSGRPSIGAGEVRQAIRERPVAEGPETLDLREARKEFERAFITTSLQSHGWRIQETADALGINRSHLWKKMRKLGIREGA